MTLTALRTPSELHASCASELADLRPSAPISRELALRLMRCGDDDLPALLAAARAAKENFKPGVITYSRKVFLPLTNLCRDYCGYCTFRRDPGEAGAHTMTPEEVLSVARAGEKLGCTEALFSLGDKPELLFPQMRDTLRRLGYKSTLHYLEAMCELVLRETSLLPHPNPGLLSAEWIARLAAVSPSMGLMLETTNRALLAPGAAHDNAPDKVPAKRLRTIEEAGKQRVPFTTGLLIGIGETCEDRVETLLAIRDLHRRYGHIQEVIVQNFRAKPTIPMAHVPEPGQGEMLRTVAVARLLMPNVNIQAPPNLNAPYYEELLEAGINDWGGISPLTPDYINPEKPWPHLEQLRLRTVSKGLQLRQRLPVYPEFLALTTRPSLLAEKLQAAQDAQGLAREKEGRMICVLTGGTGGAKFVDGLRQVIPPEQITLVVNTGDDLQWWGLYVSPDIDSITYVLSGLLSRERGWGVKGDTFLCLQAMGQLGEPTWFHTGDRDLAVHLLRSRLLAEGKTLSEATSMICDKLGVKARILPMSDSRVETRVDTPSGELSFEEYFVQRWFQDPVKSVRFAGASDAEPAPGVIEAIVSADAVLIAPSNPITSIGPILAVPGVREALRGARGKVAAVSPIIGNAPVAGPAGILMAAQGLPCSIVGVAKAYEDFLDLLICDTRDARAADLLRKSGLRVECMQTIMRSAEDKAELARFVLSRTVEGLRSDEPISDQPAVRAADQP